MSLQVNFWDLVTLLLGFFGFLFAAGKLMLTQIDRRLNDRFAAMEEARIAGGRHWEERFATVLAHDHRIDTLGDRLDQTDQTLARIEGATHSNLHHNDLQKVYDRLNEMDGKLNQMVGEFRGNNDTLHVLFNKITEKGLQ